MKKEFLKIVEKRIFQLISKLENNFGCSFMTRLNLSHNFEFYKKLTELEHDMYNFIKRKL